jgi:hypothetical protein
MASLSSTGRGSVSLDALKAIAGGPRTKQATAVLDALELLDGERLDPSRSKYSKVVVDALKKKGHGQVINRAELLEYVHGVEYFAPQRFRLEPELLVVLLAALVHSGEVVLTIPGRKFEATNVAQLAATPLDELRDFKHVERPKDWNLPSLRTLFELLGQAPGLAFALTQGGEQAGRAVRTLGSESTKLIDRIVAAQEQLRNGLKLWARNVLVQEHTEQLRKRLEDTKQFLESLQAFSNANQLKNFRYEAQEVASKRDGILALAEIEGIQALVGELNPLASYLAIAETSLPSDHDWVMKAQEVKHQAQRPTLSLFVRMPRTSET